MTKRVLFLIIGNVFLGVGIGIALFVNLGVDPYTTFNYGLGNLTGLGYANALALFNCLLFIPMFIFDRSKIGLGTFINMFLVGYIASFVQNSLTHLIPSASLLVRIGILILGIAVLTVSAGLYMSAELGESPWDATVSILSQKFHAPYHWVRIVAEIICIILGYFLKASVGVATILLAFCLGPVIAKSKVFFQKFLDLPSHKETTEVTKN